MKTTGKTKYIGIDMFFGHFDKSEIQKYSDNIMYLCFLKQIRRYNIKTKKKFEDLDSYTDKNKYVLTVLRRIIRGKLNTISVTIRGNNYTMAVHTYSGNYQLDFNYDIINNTLKEQKEGAYTYKSQVGTTIEARYNLQTTFGVFSEEFNTDGIVKAIKLMIRHKLLRKYHRENSVRIERERLLLLAKDSRKREEMMIKQKDDMEKAKIAAMNKRFRDAIEQRRKDRGEL